MITIDIINTFLAFWLKPMLLLAFILSVVKNTYHFSAAASHWLLVCALFITGVGVTALFWLPNISIGILPQSFAPFMSTALSIEDGFSSLVYWLVAFYILGVMWILFFQLSGFWAVFRLTRQSDFVVAPYVETSVNKIKTLYGIKKSIRVVHSQDITSPIMWGFITPVIVLPSVFQTWPHDRTERVLAHELSHVARHDWLTKISAKLVCALLWPVPLVWYVARRMEWFAELSCDDKVMKALNCRAEYAQDLLNLGAHESRYQQNNFSSWSVSFTRNSSIYLRIQHILDGRNHRVGMSKKRRWVDVVLCAAMIIPVSTLHAVPQVEPERYRLVRFNLVAPIFDEAAKVKASSSSALEEYPSLEAIKANSSTALLSEDICTTEFCAKIIGKGLIKILPDSPQFTEEVYVSPNEMQVELNNGKTGAKEIREALAGSFAKHALPTPIMEVKGMVPRVMVMPVYPKRALRRGIEGRVIVQFDIDEHGSTFNPRIVHAQPKRIFDKAVLKALKKSKFTPMKVEGRAVKTKNITEEYNFKLYERTTNTKAIEKPKYTRIAQMQK